MNSEDIKKILIEKLKLEKIQVFSNDFKHFEILVVSSKFIGMSTIKKQKMIYKPLNDYIINNDIHSLSIKAFAPEEWENYKLKNYTT